MESRRFDSVSKTNQSASNGLSHSSKPVAQSAVTATWRPPHALQTHFRELATVEKSISSGRRRDSKETRLERWHFGDAQVNLAARRPISRRWPTVGSRNGGAAFVIALGAFVIGNRNDNSKKAEKKYAIAASAERRPG
jgi:hypothetical protein